MKLIVIEGQMSRAGFLLLKFCFFTRDVHEGVFLHILNRKFLCFQMPHLNILSVLGQRNSNFLLFLEIFLFSEGLYHCLQPQMHMDTQQCHVLASDCDPIALSGALSYSLWTDLIASSIDLTHPPPVNEPVILYLAKDPLHGSC